MKIEGMALFILTVIVLSVAFASSSSQTADECKTQADWKIWCEGQIAPPLSVDNRDGWVKNCIANKKLCPIIIGQAAPIFASVPAQKETARSQIPQGSCKIDSAHLKTCHIGDSNIQMAENAHLYQATTKNGIIKLLEQPSSSDSSMTNIVPAAVASVRGKTPQNLDLAHEEITQVDTQDNTGKITSYDFKTGKIIPKQETTVAQKNPGLFSGIIALWNRGRDTIASLFA